MITVTFLGHSGFCRENYRGRGSGRGNDLFFRAGGASGGVYRRSGRHLCGTAGVRKDESGYFSDALWSIFSLPHSSMLYMFRFL